VSIVSILVTVYNRAAYLPEALESVLASHFQDFEVVVVDDCSQDNSVAVAEAVAARDSRVALHVNPTNLRDYANRNRAASLARGKYLKYLDADDLIYPHSLAIMVESMTQHPDAALGLAHSMPEDETPYPWILTPDQAYRKHFLGRGCLSCGPTGAIIRRDAFEAVGGFRPEWGVLSDIDLWRRLAARWPTLLLPPGLVWWRRHEAQEFTKGNADLVYLQRGYELAKQALSAAECPLPQGEREIALKRARQHYSRRLLSLVFRQNHTRTAFQLYRDSDLQLMDLINGFRAYR
jgi:glycosyltransferase involved in cell wall biosynthesis